MRNCINGPFVFLVGWGRGGFACACVLGFIIAISNKVILFALQTYLHVPDCVCIIWGGRNNGRSTAQVNSVIHYYGVRSRANICYTTTKCG